MKTLRLIGNILWCVTIGLFMFIGEIMAAVTSFCLIIPIFFGIPVVHLRMAKFVFAPFGKKVKTNFMGAPIRNSISFILGGFMSGIAAAFFGLLCCLTIVGIPLGKVMFGITAFTLAPFHAEVTNI